MQEFSTEDFLRRSVLLNRTERKDLDETEVDYLFEYDGKEIKIKRMKNNQEEFFESPFGTYYRFGKGKIETDERLMELSNILESKYH